jgi:uncharacterized protein (TIGR02145 family)
MKKKSIIHFVIIGTFLLFFYSSRIFALSYNVTFTGTGMRTNVDRVIVQNLTQKTSIIVEGGNVLNLSDSPNAIEQIIEKNNGIHVYSNNLEGKYTISFFAKNFGNVQINVYNSAGQKITGINSNLQIGNQLFQLSLSKGVFIIQVFGNGYNYTTKLLNQINANNKSEISYNNSNKDETNITQRIKSSGIIYMNYKVGDLIKLKGVSGNYVTTVCDVPTESKTINFEFIECKDGDSNYYSIVKIGDQLWMAENLRTTKFKDFSVIPNILDGKLWTNCKTSAYCDYNNDTTNSKKNGKYYNWFALSDLRKIAPEGWHVPNNAEWDILIKFFGSIVSVGRSIMDSSIPNWGNNVNSKTDCGFSIVPSGSRSGLDGSFSGVGVNSLIWCNEPDTNNIRSFYLNNNMKLLHNRANNQYGYSIRCLINSSPIITTTTVSSITSNNAKSGGKIINDGGDDITECGVCWSTSINPTIKDRKSIGIIGLDTFTNTISGLNLDSIYYVRAYAQNKIGISYGAQVNFSTKLPIINTTDLSNITDTKVTCGGSISDNGGTPISSYGICLSTSKNPTINDNKYNYWSSYIGSPEIGTYSRIIEGLTPYTTYYIRAFATNSIGTVYGNEFSFTTLKPPTGTVNDIDGNTYNYITIGTQTWMVENLKTTKFRNGQTISNITDNNTWANSVTAAWCDYLNLTTNGTTFGHLYNWYAIGDSRNIAPAGWHVPTDAEWTILENYLNKNGFSSDNSISKSLASNTKWTSSFNLVATGNNIATNNKSGFSALPAGNRYYSSGVFFEVLKTADFWSSTEYIGDNTYAWGRNLYFSTNYLNTNNYKKNYGLSIRCIRD